MAIKRANTLDDEQFQEVLEDVTKSSKHPLVDRVAFLFNFKAGLRVQEIAGMEWQKNILGPTGKFREEEHLVPGSKGRARVEKSRVIYVSEDIVKGGTNRQRAYGTARTIPMHPLLEASLMALLDEGHPGPFVLPSLRGGAAQSLKARAHALRMRIARVYDRIDYEGCSSHSGRRTFITKASRTVQLHGGSLADVQRMVGHHDLSTTQGYIDSSSAQFDVVKFM